MLTTTATEIDIDLHSTQRRFVMDGHRFCAFVAGIGSGKTVAGAVKAHLYLLSRPRSLGLVVSPTYRMSLDVVRRTWDWAAEQLGQAGTWRLSDMTWTSWTGAEVLFRSADEPDKLRGPSVSWAWIDEAAMCGARTWDIVLGRLRQDGKAGPAWITTTPRGRNWVWSVFVANATQDHALHRVATARNPFLDRSYHDAMASAYEGRFADQELGGEFVAWEGLVYEAFDAELQVRPITNQERASVREWVLGVDWGYAHPGVCLRLGTDGRRYYLDREEYRTRVPIVAPDQAVDWVRLIRDALPPEDKRATVACDPSEPGNIRALQDAGVNAVPADNAIRAGIQRCAAAVPHLVVDPSCRHFLAEVQAYSYPERDGQVQRDTPTKANDHAMDAWRYAVAHLVAAEETGTSYLGNL